AAAAIEGAVATVGRLTVEPGAVNVVPGRVRATVDARAPDGARFEALLAALPEADVRVLEPIELAEEPRAALRRELGARRLPPVELASGAGHDAGILASAGVPSALLFVRSLAGGASHSPEEDSSEDDVALALEVLAGAIARLAAA
ncbi:MAG: M20/M25/M40 family metallo-hydrolase, partial [Actinomycetota bacterium]|nr:M20/M25/M40 family metallo-hydrolase [Actinomycetota bacterium]